MKPQEFIALIGPAAQASAKTTGVPASFTVAQAALNRGGVRLPSRAMAKTSLASKPIRRGMAMLCISTRVNS